MLGCFSVTFSIHFYVTMARRGQSIYFLYRAAAALMTVFILYLYNNVLTIRANRPYAYTKTGKIKQKRSRWAHKKHKHAYSKYNAAVSRIFDVFFVQFIYPLLLCTNERIFVLIPVDRRRPLLRDHTIILWWWSLVAIVSHVLQRNALTQYTRGSFILPHFDELISNYITRILDE